MIKEAIAKLTQNVDLSRQETQEVWLEIMEGHALPTQIASFLTALRMKGETVEEITGAAIIMRKFVTKIKSKAKVILDTCGTGGDESNTFNISTICALVVAGAGVTVAKHGNRSVTSRCGSADLLEALGVNLNIDPAKLEECLEKVGIGFLFAPLLHPAMKYATPVRREIGIRTIFNILGPLTNPASATHQLLGVYDEGLVETLANVLGNLGLKHALVVQGKDGLDEVSTTAPTLVAELKQGGVHKFEIRPEDFGIKRASLEDLRAGTLELNCRIAMDILQGMGGPKRDIVVLNAGCALFTADKAKDIREGIELAKKSIDSGKAMEKLEQLKAFTH